jgi:hypothetical protein
MGSLSQCIWIWCLAALLVLIALNDDRNLFSFVLLGLGGSHFPAIFRISPFDIRAARNASFL